MHPGVNFGRRVLFQWRQGRRQGRVRDWFRGFGRLGGCEACRSHLHDWRPEASADFTSRTLQGGCEEAESKLQPDCNKSVWVHRGQSRFNANSRDVRSMSARGAFGTTNIESGWACLGYGCLRDHQCRVRLCMFRLQMHSGPSISSPAVHV